VLSDPERGAKLSARPGVLELHSAARYWGGVSEQCPAMWFLGAAPGRGTCGTRLERRSVHSLRS
jgi:hypothetical protein